MYEPGNEQKDYDDTKTWSLSEKPYAQQMEQGQVSDG
jgi:hypothetical protein